MNKVLIVIFLFFSSWISSYAQPCGVAQSVTASQQLQINNLEISLDTALKYENLFQIDSLSAELKNIYALEGGRPDGVETYFALTSSVTWLNTTNAILLSRALIAADSMVYVDLWKAGKGMSPPSYLPNSLFLRSSAEIAAGLLKIADKETDLTRKSLYQSWATRAFDSLATMQLPSGAFPFPDLRTYGDPVFTPIINNFMLFCGADSVTVLQNGWIVDDKGTGEFKFDAGVIANAYYEAYTYTGNIQYKNIALSVGNYLKPLKYNLNYNYNTFVSLGLTRAYQLTNDTSYLNRAIKNIRYAVYPGQISSGRWVDGHNANSRYHNIIVQNSVPTIPLISTSDPYKAKLDSMTFLAVRNLVEYSYSCNSATGYRWLIKSYCLPSSIIPSTLRDSIADLIGRHINQSAINGKYLDVPTMGEYMELPCVTTGLNETESPSNFKATIYPNPFSKETILNCGRAFTDASLTIFDSFGREVRHMNNISGNTIRLERADLPCGVFLIRLEEDGNFFVGKIVVIE